MEIRVTKLVSHYHCPYRFKNERVVETEAMRLGSEVHYHLSKLNSGVEVNLPVSEEVEKLIKGARLFSKEFPPPLIEEQMKVQLSSSWTLYGTPDIVLPQENLVHDYKTGYVTYSVKSSPQLFLYWWLYQQTANHSIKKGILTFEFLRKKAEDTIELENKEIEKVVDKVANDFLKDSTFEPRVNPFCKYCSLALDCPLMRDFLQSKSELLKKFAVDVMKSRLTEETDKLEDPDEREVIGDATILIKETVVKKVDVKKAISLMTPEDLIPAITALNFEKLPEFVKDSVLKEEFRRTVIVDYNIA